LRDNKPINESGTGAHRHGHDNHTHHHKDHKHTLFGGHDHDHAHGTDAEKFFEALKGGGEPFRFRELQLYM
jgi:hypothetical protein